METELDERGSGRSDSVLFRELNERIAERLAGPVEECIDFVCECDDPTCFRVLRVSLADYRATRAHPGRFLLLPGHRPPVGAAIICEEGGFSIVETESRLLR